MTLKLLVGLRRNIGEARGDVCGASVTVETEVDSALVAEPAKLKDQLRPLFVLVRTLLTEELVGGKAARPAACQEPAAPAPAAQLPHPGGQAPRGGGARPATPAQLKALHALARRQGFNLLELVRGRCQVACPDDLTLREASALIDSLKPSGDQPAG
jgi:hypothetical protein